MDTKTKAAALAIAGGLVTVSGCILKKAFPMDVTYTAGDGIGADIITTEVQNSTITLPSCTFTNSGKAFAGWSDGSNIYQAGESYTLGTTPVTFTATWDVLDTVTFVVDGVTTTQNYSAGSQIVLENKTKTASVGSYSFLGWNDGTTTHPAGSTYTVAGDVTLTAQWSYVGGEGTLNWEQSVYFGTSANGDATGTVTLNPTGHLYLYRNFPTAAYFAKVDISNMENVTSALLNVKVTKVNLSSIMTVYEVDKTAYENAFGNVSNGVTMNTSALPGGTVIASQTYSSTSGNNAGFYVSPGIDITNWLKSKVEAGEKYVYIMIKNTHTGSATKDGIRIRWFHTDAKIDVTTATN